MNQYKPQFMGKVLPVDNPAKLTDFCVNQYDSFSKIYDACKDHAESISGISSVETPKADDTSLTVKVSAGSDTLGKIAQESDGKDSISVNGDTITANVKKN